MMNMPQARDAMRDFLTALGQDVESDGLKDTPKRVAKAYAEMLSGYELDPRDILSTNFEADGWDEMVALRNVNFYSLCEHHLLPFHGTATIAYVPSGKVVGLSKLARVVECFARRLQIQERMTKQIADALREVLDPRGFGVTLKAQHLCMCARGIRKPNSEMVTTMLGGFMKEDEKARYEYIRLAGI